jgi:nitroreductase
LQKGSDARTADHPVDRLFLDRWSPRAMSGEPISDTELLTLFEAARWAPSASNLQPWRLLYGRRETPQWPLFYDLLKGNNRLWCERAAVLVVFASLTAHPKTGTALVTHSYDTGAAWENFALQGTLSGLVVHGMQGFDYALARERLRIPDAWRVEAMAAVGRPGPVEHLAEHLREREAPSGRIPVGEFTHEGAWGPG